MEANITAYCQRGRWTRTSKRIQNMSANECQEKNKLDKDTGSVEGWYFTQGDQGSPLRKQLSFFFFFIVCRTLVTDRCST